MEWVSVKERLPGEYKMKFLKYEYSNGNEGRAVGFVDEGEWNIEWADDYPDAKDITHWLSEGDDVP